MAKRQTILSEFFPPEELLKLAQQAGDLGIFEWHVSAEHVRLSQQLMALHEIDSFNGGFDDWIELLFREDRPRVAHLIRTAMSDGIPDLRAEYRINRKRANALK